MPGEVYEERTGVLYSRRKGSRSLGSLVFRLHCTEILVSTMGRQDVIGQPRGQMG